MARISDIELFRRELIPRHDDEPYLERLIIFRCKWFGILLHRFIGGDDECLHDHPWKFIAILLKGGYHEVTRFIDPYCINCAGALSPERPCLACIDKLQSTWYPPGSILFRSASWTHRVDTGKQRCVVSLVVHGPKVRSWGFWTKLHGWLHHSKYSYHNHCV